MRYTPTEIIEGRFASYLGINHVDINGEEKRRLARDFAQRVEPFSSNPNFGFGLAITLYETQNSIVQTFGQVGPYLRESESTTVKETVHEMEREAIEKATKHLAPFRFSPLLAIDRIKLRRGIQQVLSDYQSKNGAFV